MAIVTLVYNTNIVSGSLAYYDPRLEKLNQGSVAIITGSANDTSSTDLSSSFYGLQSYGFLTSSLDFLTGGAHTSDLSASAFDIQTWMITSGSYMTFLMSQPFPSGSVVIVPTTTFIFRGFYPATGQYEFWQGTSRNTPPPSGNPLIDITVIGELPYNNTF